MFSQGNVPSIHRPAFGLNSDCANSRDRDNHLPLFGTDMKVHACDPCVPLQA